MLILNYFQIVHAYAAEFVNMHNLKIQALL